MAGNSGATGGASTGSKPSKPSLQLMRTNSWSPVSGPLWPSVGVDWKSRAATAHASCCVSVSPSKCRVCCANRLRTAIWSSVRGLAGVA